jgi:hypothetical protein
MSQLLWIVAIFFGVVLLALVVSEPSPSATRAGSRKLPRSANRGGG